MIFHHPSAYSSPASLLAISQTFQGCSLLRTFQLLRFFILSLYLDSSHGWTLASFSSLLHHLAFPGHPLKQELLPHSLPPYPALCFFVAFNYYLELYYLFLSRVRSTKAGTVFVLFTVLSLVSDI